MIKFLIVGGFPEKNSNIIGGQITACKNLFPYNLYSKKDTIRFDTTQISNPPPKIFYRLYLSLIRLPLFIKNIVFKKPKKVIILMSSGTSFLEKTIYTLISYILGSKTIVVPRSDLIIKQVESKIIYKIFFKILVFSTNKFIFQSNTFLYSFPFLKNKEYKIIPNCINFKINQKIIKKNIPSNNEYHLLYVGWIEPIKNLSLFLEAAKYLKDSLPNKSIILHIVGEGTDFLFLKNKSKKLNLKTIFHGWVSDVSELNSIYNQSNCFCLTSIYEGFPNVVLEAMSHGLPIISTRVGALPYWLKEGQNILFSEENDPKSFAKKLYNLFSEKNLYDSISKNNLYDIKNKFNCKNIAKDLKIILEK